MKRIFVFCSLAAIIIACSKDKFQTKPQIRIKSVSSEIVPPNSGLRVTLEFTDKEGDVSDSIFWVRQRLNKKSQDTIAAARPIPSFPNTSKGEIEVNFAYAFDLTSALPAISIPGTGSQKEPDTLRLKFVVKDKAGNKSDTASTDVIVIRQ